MKRTAYHGLSREQALARQRAANRRYAATHSSADRKRRDIERLGETEYLRRQRERARRYYARHTEICKARQREQMSRPNVKEAARKWKREHRAKNAERYRAAQRQWHSDNSVRVAAELKKRRDSDPDYRARVRKHNRESYARNRASRIAKVYEWKAANTEKAKEITKRGVLKRRSLKPAGKYSTVAFHARCAFYGWQCVYCAKPLTSKTVTIDHVIPLSKGGSNWPSNLVPACASCNKRKHARTPQEYRQAIIASPAVP